MKVCCRTTNLELVRTFLAGWVPERPSHIQAYILGLWDADECEPLDLDCEPEELANCFDALTKKGFSESIKALVQGDHFYRSDTGKCPRCWRYRPEVHWNGENLEDCRHQELCDRCSRAVPSERIE